jgi:hypothetical protein
MTQKLTESPEAMAQRIRSRQSRASSARSFPSEFHPILKLQRTLGNQRVEQLIHAKHLTTEGKITGLLRKLTVGGADDQYEHEANRLAREVVNTSNVVAACSMQGAVSPKKEKDARPQTKPLAASITPFVPQRQC